MYSVNYLCAVLERKNALVFLPLLKVIEGYQSGEDLPREWKEPGNEKPTVPAMLHFPFDRPHEVECVPFPKLFSSKSVSSGGKGWEGKYQPISRGFQCQQGHISFLKPLGTQTTECTGGYQQVCAAKHCSRWVTGCKYQGGPAPVSASVPFQPHLSGVAEIVKCRSGRSGDG